MFEIKESPGKGLGMFATREIQPGELIILEKPLVTFDSYSVAESIIEKLSSEDRQILNALEDCHNPQSKTVLGILRTNSLPLGKVFMLLNVSRQENSLPNSKLF